MWQTCHCNGQLDKCRGVAERCGPHTIPPRCYPQCIEESREQVMQGQEKERRNERRGEEVEGRREGGGGSRDRESDFQRDNEPLNDG